MTRDQAVDAIVQAQADMLLRSADVRKKRFKQDVESILRQLEQPADEGADREAA